MVPDMKMELMVSQSARDRASAAREQFRARAVSQRAQRLRADSRALGERLVNRPDRSPGRRLAIDPAVAALPGGVRYHEHLKMLLAELAQARRLLAEMEHSRDSAVGENELLRRQLETVSGLLAECEAELATTTQALVEMNREIQQVHDAATARRTELDGTQVAEPDGTQVAIPDPA